MKRKRTLKASAKTLGSSQYRALGPRGGSRGTSVIEHYVVGDPQRIEQLRADRQWYFEQRERLAEELPNRFLAIIGQRVVDSDSNIEALTRRVYERSERAIFMPYTGEAAEAGIAEQRSPRTLEH